MTAAFLGLSAFPVTPADAAGRVDTDALGRLVARAAAAGVQSLGVLGSTGAYVYLPVPERARALAAAVEAAGGVPVIAGVGALRQDEAIANARVAEAAGAAGLLVAPVSYLPLTEDEVAGLVAAVAGATGLPVCVYNNPTTTHFTVTEALLARLAAIPRVAAVKNPAPADGDVAAQIARLRPAVPAGFSLGYSGDMTIAAALGAGADAWYSVLAGAFPAVAAEMWAARGDAGRLAAIDARLAPVWEAFRRHTSFRCVHAAVAMLGLGRAIPPLPIRPLAPEAEAEFRDALAAAGLETAP
ncbi:dihydrodipicolinate synthase family protein [Frigidibacter sp. MR17.24]|uniref:dihydrodipicolinate synthase family protein n=1 Tax=Frigidibacter sp. MR17.24 TaxID=3127345 RepID=UPI003012D0CC